MFVEKKILHLQQPFVTESGVALKRPAVAYEDYGPEDAPVILVAHGAFSDQHAAGRYDDGDDTLGWWHGLIGPGKALDTERYRVICLNSLGSMYGSTGPASMDPDTGCRYGPHFPAITLVDTVRFQRAALDALGVDELHLVAGPAMGALQGLQMAALYPELVGGVIAVAAAGRLPPGGIAMHQFMINLLRMDPAFQGGWYDASRPLLAMKTLHQFMRLAYAHEDLLKTGIWDAVHDGPHAQEERTRLIARYLDATLDYDVPVRDPNCYITLMQALNSYDLGRDTDSYEAGVLRIQCPVLLMNIDTDSEFKLHWAEELADILNTRTPGQAKVGVIDSPWGHWGALKEFEQMEDSFRRFMQTL